ncbi:MAG: DEAD/DEAH box helicase [Romboutsia sp.]
MNRSFKDFKLDKNILKALDNLEYKNPSKVQSEVIPSLINKDNVIVKSKTGSGKTGSFAIPICQNIDIDNTNIQGIVVVPTRELALQVKEEISNIGRLKKVRCSAIFGKQPIKEQIRELKQRVHVVVATPGRIIDHIERQTINLDNVEYFIIDEADKMLNKGFIDDMETIFNAVSKSSTVGLFSATIDKNIEYVSEKFMSKPNIIEVEYIEAINKKQIVENRINVEEREKYDKLKKVIYSQCPNSLMIFCNTRERVMRLHKKLKEDNFLVGQLHGDMSQDKRLFIIKDFKKHKFNILVSTDVASRGIHVDDISLVVNFDVPHDKENYVHRIGRTGRKNKFGKSITMVSSNDEKYLEEIEEYLEYDIEELDKITEEEVNSGRNQFKEKSRKLVKDFKIKSYDKNIHSDLTRIYINAGKKKKIRVIDIVGAFSNIEGITGEDIGVIDVQDLCSYIDILNNKGDIILRKHKEISIKKKMVKVRKDNKN